MMTKVSLRVIEGINQVFGDTKRIDLKEKGDLGKMWDEGVMRITSCRGTGF